MRSDRRLLKVGSSGDSPTAINKLRFKIYASSIFGRKNIGRGLFQAPSQDSQRSKTVAWTQLMASFLVLQRMVSGSRVWPEMMAHGADPQIKKYCQKATHQVGKPHVRGSIVTHLRHCSPYGDLKPCQELTAEIDGDGNYQIWQG